MNAHIYTIKALKALNLRIASCYWTAHTCAVCWLNGIKCGRRIKALGRARINVSLGGKATIGKSFYIRTGQTYTEVGSIGSRETREDVRKASIVIGNNVFIGTNAIICKGVTLGDGVIVAAGSVVVKSIPAGEVWGGNPATRIQ